MNKSVTSQLSMLLKVFFIVAIGFLLVAKKSGTTKIATSTDVAKKRKNSGGNKDGTTRRNKDSEIQAVKGL